MLPAAQAVLQVLLLAPFAEDDLSFLLPIGGGKLLRLQDLAVDFQHLFELPAPLRRRKQVARVIVAGLGIEMPSHLPAVAAEVIRQSLRILRRGLEYHVLGNVRDAFFPVVFIGRTHSHVQPRGQPPFRRRDFENMVGQAVGQPAFGVNGLSGVRGGCGARTDKADKEDEEEFFHFEVRPSETETVAEFIIMPVFI